jgi:hypothetical protein
VAHGALGFNIQQLHNIRMTSIAKYLNFDEDGWAPYAIFGMCIGLYSASAMMAIHRLPI